VESINAYGGGIYVDVVGLGSPIITNNTISHNQVKARYDGYGGGIYIGSGTGVPIVSDNTISYNFADSGGGGIYYRPSHIKTIRVGPKTKSQVISNNKIIYNSGSQGIRVSGSGRRPLDIINNIISYNSGVGLRLSGSYLQATVKNNVISCNSDDGIYAEYFIVTISNCTIYGNLGRGIYIGYGHPEAETKINQNNIYNNAEYALDNHAPNDVDASDNWWDTTDPMEINQKIYDFYDNEKYSKALYNPFLMSPDTNSPIIIPTGLTATIAATTITLKWKSMTLDDLKGYKIYYDTDSKEPPYEGTEATEGKSPIDVGKNTSYKLSGLKQGVKYYIAVTAYDIQGNEGWYGEIVTVEIPTGE